MKRLSTCPTKIKDSPTKLRTTQDKTFKYIEAAGHGGHREEGVVEKFIKIESASVMTLVICNKKTLLCGAKIRRHYHTIEARGFILVRNTQIESQKERLNI